MTWADYGKPISADPEILGAAELVRRLYEDLGEGTGGPLHWMLEDGNIYDDQMPDADEQVKIFAYLWNGDFKKWSQAAADVSTELRQAIQDTCRGILYAFDRMNEAERTCVLAWHWLDIKRELPDWYAKHRTPEHLESAREQADEFVRLALAGPPVKAEAKACVPIPCPPFTDGFDPDLSPPLMPVPDWIRHADLFADPPEPARFSGVIYPNIGSVFGLDTQIVGPGIVDTQANPDGSVTVTWERDAPELPHRVNDTSFGYCATAPGVGLVRDALDDPRQIRPIYPEREGEP